ncbi:MAG TPA: hypothetical protein VGC22_00715 [Chitinophaga sp.]
MNAQLKVAATAAVALAMSVLVSCSKDKDSGPSNPGNPNNPPANTVKLASNGTFGSILTDSTGKSLYFFSVDYNGASNCTGGCLAAWPAFYIDPTHLTLDDGLKAEDFGTITRGDGAKQTTYKGWPLYYFANDAAAGDTKGDNVGGNWFIAKPDYSVMLAQGQLVGNDGKNYVFSGTPGTVSLGDGASLYLTDDRGRTLYAFAAKDKNGVNNYTTTDATHNATWPIYPQAKVLKVPSALNADDFTIITILGQTQLAYKGWPTYYFGGDQLTMGLTKGVSVPSPNVWPVLNTTSPAAPLQ